MKTMNEFLKENQIDEDAPVTAPIPTNTVSVGGKSGSMVGDWKRYLKPILMRTAREIKRKIKGK